MRVVYCLKRSDLAEKMISPVSDKPFIQMVKYSFLTKELFIKVLCRAAHIKFLISSRISSVFSSHASASHLRDVYCVKRSGDLVGKMISLLIFVTNGSFKQ